MNEPRIGAVLAIDFGTSNTVAAVATSDGHVRAARLSGHSELMPSAVMLTAEGLIVGDAALRSAFLDPSSFERSPKRRLQDGEVLLGSTLVAATDLVAAVLAEVLRRAVRLANGEAIVRCILTHPDRWGTAAIELFRQSAVRAGIPPSVLMFVSEAKAAAWHYATHGAPLRPGQRLAVVDYGAGTCDVAVLESTGNEFRVIVADGHDGLGGDDIDARIWDWLMAELAGANPALYAELTNSRDLRTQLTVGDRIREAKESLSEASSVPIAVTGRAGEHTALLTRTEFEALIRDDIHRVAELTQTLVSAAGAPPPSVVYLAGGSSLIVRLQRELARIAPIATVDDPKTVVARGAIAVAGAGDSGTPRSGQIRRPAETGRRPNRRAWRKIAGLSAAAAIMVVVLVALAFIRPWSKASNGGGSTPTGADQTQIARAFEGNYLVTYTPKSYNGSPPTQAEWTMNWAVHTSCGSANGRCTATIAETDPTGKFADSSLVGDFIDGRWVVTDKWDSTCDPQGAGPAFDVEKWMRMTFASKGVGRLAGSRTMFMVGGCLGVWISDVTVKRMNDSTQPNSGSDPANMPAYVPPPDGSYLDGLYQTNFSWANGNSENFTIRYYGFCLRSGVECASSPASIEQSSTQLVYAGADVQQLIENYPSACTDKPDSPVNQFQSKVVLKVTSSGKGPARQLSGTKEYTQGEPCPKTNNAIVTISRVGD